MEIDIKLEGLDEIIKKLRAGPEAANKAIAFTINEAIKVGKTVATEEIAKKYNIKRETFRERLKIKVNATANSLVGVLTAKGHGIPLSVFDVKQQGFKVLHVGPKNSKETYLVRGNRRRGPVTRLIKKSSGRKTQEGKYGNKPFLAINAKGRLVVWERKEKERWPVGEHLGPGLALLLGTKNIHEKVKKGMLDKFYARIRRNLAYFMGMTGGSPPPG
jgi:hypothetical protein